MKHAATAICDLSAHTALFARAIEKNGAEHQHRMLQEECAELIVAVNHLSRHKCGTEQVAMEWADVLIMLHEIALLMPADLLREAVVLKLERLHEVLR